MVMSKAKASHRDELQRVPGVGPSIANDLRAIGMTQDRCLLYVFRCAVYFAETPKPNPKKLDWWAWKDR